MLHFTTRRPESLKVANTILKYVKKNFNKETALSVSSFLDQFDILRNRAALAEMDESGLNTLAMYYRYLICIEPKMTASAVGLKFTWTDSLSRKKDTDASFVIEKAAVLFNIGAVYSRLGAITNMQTAEGPRVALSHFQNAAGCFEKVRELAREIKTRTTTDMTPEFLTMAVNVLLAQGYVCMYDKIDKASPSKVNIAKIAKAIAKLYGQAQSIASCAPLTGNLSREYVDALVFHELSYRAACLYWQSFVDDELAKTTGQHYGRKVGRLRHAKGLLERALSIRGLRGEILERGRSLAASVAQALTEAERINLSVYIDRVPQIHEIPEPDDINMVVAKFPPPIDLASPIEGSRCLDRLVPPAVVALSNQYKEVLQALVNGESNKLASMNRDVFDGFNSMALPHKLHALGGESGVPEGLWAKIKEAQVRGGFNYLDQMVKSLLNMSENCGKTLAEVEAQLQDEENQDSQMRQNYPGKWQRAHSSALNSGLRQEISKYGMKVGEAQSVDQVTIEMFMSNEAQLRLLGKSKTELDEMLPSSIASTGSEHPSVQGLRDALNSVEALQKSAAEKFSELSATAQQDNITGELMKVHAQSLPKEPVFERELVKYNGLKGELSSIYLQVQAALGAVRAASAQFDAAIGARASNPERVSFLESLEVAVVKFQEVGGNAAQGHQFYQQLFRHLNLLQQKANDFCYSRNLEKNDLLTSMTASSFRSTPSASSAYSGYLPPPAYQPPSGYNPYRHP
jgi:programmed cell death 6-interacting protein